MHADKTQGGGCRITSEALSPQQFRCCTHMRLRAVQVRKAGGGGDRARGAPALRSAWFFRYNSRACDCQYACDRCDSWRVLVAGAFERLSDAEVTGR